MAADSERRQPPSALPSRGRPLPARTPTDPDVTEVGAALAARSTARCASTRTPGTSSRPTPACTRSSRSASSIPRTPTTWPPRSRSRARARRARPAARRRDEPRRPDRRPRGRARLLAPHARDRRASTRARARARVQPGVVQDDLNRAAARARPACSAPDTSTAQPGDARRDDRQQLVRAASSVALRDDDRPRARRSTSCSPTARARGLEPVRRGARSRRGARRHAGGRDLPRAARRSSSATARRSGATTRATGARPAATGSTGCCREAGRFDLAQLVVGSEGTLAVVVEATVALVPRPRRAVAAPSGTSRSTRRGDRGDRRRDGAATPPRSSWWTAPSSTSSRRKLEFARARRASSRATPARCCSSSSTATRAPRSPPRLDALDARVGARTATATTRCARVDARRPGRGARRSARPGLGLLMAREPRHAPAARVRRGHRRRRPSASPTTSREFAAILDAPRPARRLLRPLLGRLPAHPPVRRPARARRGRTHARGRRGGASSSCSSYGGVNTSEHGDGLVRSEFNRRMFGDELYEAMREVKRALRPRRRA